MIKKNMITKLNTDLKINTYWRSFDVGSLVCASINFAT